MKIRFVNFLAISFLLLFTNCTYSDWHKKPHNSIEYSVVKHSDLFNEKNMVFTIDSSDNNIYIHLQFKDLQNFPFPVNYLYKDTLSNTTFKFNLLCNGKIIQSDYHSFRNTMNWNVNSSETRDNLDFQSDTISLSNGNTIDLQIPFYAFHKLKEGKKTIELKMSQDMFSDNKYILQKDSSYKRVYLFAQKSLLSAVVKFDIQVPAIYKSKLIGLGLQLKNDSTFSPAGMDNTIWNSSYPDIYWSVNCPKDYFYAQTPYETSTDHYVGHDTFNLYHYTPNDSIRISVYDHDNLSRDDFLGYWEGSIDFLQKTPLRRITFGNIKWFDIKMGKAEKVN